MRLNKSGRQANRGFEGLAITPDGKALLAVLQSPLLQDGAMAGKHRGGVNVRVLAVNIANGKTKEFVYPLSDGRKNGLNEILAVNGRQFLVHERDGEEGDKATFKAIFLADLQGATDVSGMTHLPADKLPPGVRPMSKKLLINLLDPAWGLAGKLPAKTEGLAFGPDLPDGRHLLLLTSDNDFHPRQAIQFYAFAIDPSVLPDYQPQRFEDPSTSSNGT